MGHASRRRFRRDELIDATITAIYEDGLKDTTLAAIGKRAGLSPGLVNHYFDGKEALLEATMRRLLRNLGDDIAARLPAEPTPLGRLHAIIDGCFSRRHFLPESMVAWLTFWLEVRRNPRFARLQRILNHRFESNIMFALRQMAPAPLAEDIFLGLTALIDGFWWAYALDAKRVQPARARRLCRDYLASRLPQNAATKISRPKRLRAASKSRKARS
jgi:TetR/AcrR family transcriptional regulator, transcriptional repressor of bet genes